MLHQEASCQNLSIALGRNKATYYPFYRFFGESFYPTIQSTFEYPLNSDKKNQLFAGIQLSFNWHKVMGNSLNIGVNLSYRNMLTHGFYPEIGIGSSINMTFAARKLYTLTQDGNWEKSDKQLKALYQLPLFLSFGKRFERHDVYLRYQYNIMFGFNESIEYLPIDMMLLGYRYHFSDTR